MVVDSEMPKGVEHTQTTAPNTKDTTVVDSEMPKGVEYLRKPWHDLN